MKPEDINYQPLEDMSKAWSTVMRTAIGGFAWLLAIASIVAGVYLFTRPFISVFGVFLPIAYFSYINHLVVQYRNQAWQRFAEANGWAFDTTVTESPEDALPQSLLYGNQHNFSPIILATLGGTSCDLFTYDCTTGSGKSSTTHYFTVANVALSEEFPHIILWTKKERDADLRNDLSDAETLKLEGNFNDYFKLQIEKGQEVDALKIITPDVMQFLINYGRSEDIEIIDKNMYFIVRGNETDPDTIKQLIQSVTEIGTQIRENIRLSTAQAQPAETIAPETKEQVSTVSA